MKTLQKTLLALAAGSLLSMGAQAAVSYGNGYTGQPYVGVKVGQFNLDTDGASNPTAYGVYGGYNFDPNFGLEAEYVGSDDADYYNGDVDAKTYGLYGTYRYGFNNTPVYAKGKLGVARTEIDGDSRLPYASVSDKSTRLAGGLGLGYSVNPDFGIEAEYDIVGSDADLWTVGAHLKF
ncbi:MULTISPECIES: porin family protein [unclassified Psychrobacter]|uniref:porin family protein n=1 Tax=unclassified Psychrobacter TaxID=196806 RepID=UPI0025D0387B|nr:MULTISPECIES: porin family protein [unclassified Psychrobacter]